MSLLYTSPAMPEQQCFFHPDRMTGVSCSRCDRPICPDDMYPAPVGQHCPICAGRMREGPLGQTGYRMRERAERIPLTRFVARGRVTTVIVAANLIVFALMLATGSLTSARTLLRFGALTNPLPSSEWWRLITAMFVHLGFAHVLFNMFSLIIFGPAIENRYGKWRFLLLYLVSGTLGSAVSLAFSHSTLSAGASGAIFGIIGAWLALALWNRHQPGMRGQLQSWIFLVAINIYFGATVANIDLRAHIGGLVGGFVIGSALEAAARERGAARAVLQVAGYGVVLIATYALTATHVI